MSTAPHPVGVVLDGPPTPAWQERALAGLAQSPVLDVIDVRLTGARRRGVTRRAHAAVERRLFQLGSDALAPVLLDQSALDPRTGSEPAATLLVWLCERQLPSEEPRDVLYLRHGGLVEPAEKAFDRATLDGARCLETEVLLRTGKGTILVERTFSGLRPFSTTLSRDLALWKLAALIRRAAERVPGLDLPAPAPGSAKAGPSTAKLFLRAASAWPRALATRLLFRRLWYIRLRQRGQDLTRGWSEEHLLVRWKRGHVYADPFLFEHGGRHHLFCEEMPLGATRAVISHAELHLDGTAADPPIPVLARPYHLSYPFVFAHEGEVFLIPETSAAGRVELYRAVGFPNTWRREAILLDDLDAADATIFSHGDRLWLFAAVAAADASSLDELHLFWADTPRGPWHAHPRNPVVSDVRCARPAGAVQQWGSRLVRPGQDGSRRYGGAISFREIDVLSASDYAEHEIARLEPGDLGVARATHTYASDGRFEAVDLRRRELRVKLRLAALASDLPHRRGRAGRRSGGGPKGGR
jgi:hypothetical protein